MNNMTSYQKTVLRNGFDGLRKAKKCWPSLVETKYQNLLGMLLMADIDFSTYAKLLRIAQEIKNE